MSGDVVMTSDEYDDERGIPGWIRSRQRLAEVCRRSSREYARKGDVDSARVASHYVRCAVVTSGLRKGTVATRELNERHGCRRHRRKTGERENKEAVKIMQYIVSRVFSGKLS